MKLLLNDKRIVDINKVDYRFGQTAFLVACRHEHFEVMEYILANEREIDLNAKNNKGKTAIDIAREREKIEILGWGNEIQEVKRNWAKMTELLESFERNPNETRAKLRIQLGLAGFFFSFFFFFFF